MYNSNKLKPRNSAKSWVRKAKWLAFGAAALLFSPVAQAQISGTKTVCASGCDYSTINAAITALKSNGINGKTTIRIKPGAYNEYFLVEGGKSGIGGISATNTLTFIGTGSAPTDVHIYNTNSYVVALDNISYVTIENVHIEQKSPSDYYQGLMLNYASYCNVKNCRITADVTGTGYWDLNPLLVQYSTDNVIDGNTIRGGHDAINDGNYNYGCERNIYKNNKITKFYYDGIGAYYSDNNQYLNNYIDSGSYMYASAVYSSEETNAKYHNNNMVLNSMYYGVFLNPVGNLEFVNNMLLGASDCYQMVRLEPYASNIKIKFHHNTMDNPNSGGVCVYYSNGNGADISFQNNILTSVALTLNMVGGKGPNLNDIIEGNNYYRSTSGNLLNYNGTGYATLSAYQAAASTNGHGLTDMNMAVTYKSATDLHVDQTTLTPYAKNIGVQKDIDGDARCASMVTSGADESTYSGNPHYGKPSKPSFTGPSTAYEGNPTLFYNAAKGSGIIYKWYVNGKWVSDSFHLETIALTGPTSKVKLVALTCGGKDSVETTVTVSTPPNVPVSDFISDKNVIRQGDAVKFTDLSKDYPAKWQYTVTPEFTFVDGVKVATYAIVSGSLTSPSMQLRFDYPGKYKVCLTASNKKGAGNTECKTDYINVIPATNMPTGGTINITNSEGYLYDNGGPSKNPSGYYVQNKAIIGGCADSVYLIFTKFDLACGADYLRVFEGNNPSTGKSLNKCNSTSYVGSNFGGVTGYTGGSTSSCASICTPAVTDTFKAKGSMYIEMGIYGYTSTPGFEAYYWTTPKSEKVPVAKFSSADSICVNGVLSFKNESTGDNVKYYWDTDGDLSTLEPQGENANWPYFAEGQVTVTLIAQNCGGSDTFQKTITVFAPDAPVTSFKADNTNPTLNDIVFLSTTMEECVDNYKWTFTHVNGIGQATFVNGTKNSSAAPQVMFSATGCYSVELYTANSTGDDNLKLNCYINVKDAYCVPSVMNKSADLGISKVIFNTINNSTPQTTDGGYANYAAVQSQSTTIEIAATYSLTVERKTNNNSATRTVYIDWNLDGDFTDAGEKVAEEVNKTTLSWSTDITVPSTAKIGATIMRVVINQGSQTNTPCGPHKFGEFEDYRLYISEYVTLPVITLVGEDTISMEQGSTYTEPGYSATSLLYGNITSNVVVTTPTSGYTSIPGTYTYTYNVKDVSGNEAIPVKRIVIITPDTTAPNLIVAKPDTILLQVNMTFTIPSVISADDLVDGSLLAAVKNVSTVDNTKVGDYTVTYTVTDRTQNTATVVRYVKVIDTIMPTITLVGGATVYHEVGTPYNDSNVIVKDNYYTESELRNNLSIQSNVDENVVGSYTVTYTLTDPYTSRTVSVTRTVEVRDTEMPTLTLIGDTAITLEVFSTLNDPGVKVSDNYDKNLNVTTGGDFYTNFANGRATLIGKYTIVYSVTDASGNTSTISRTIIVVDTEAPTAILIGDPSATVCRWATYTDAGVTVTDNYDKTSDL
ncbi:MAG: immunoglobulin-like domain-containing protein, partial [Bacteroidia bacterium]